MKLQDLIQLIYHNELSELKQQKLNGVDFTITDPQNQNNLLIAYCGYGYDEKYAQTDMVQFLLDCGIDINDQQNERGANLSPLHMAVSNGFTVIIQTLLENNAETEIRDANGNTPLLNAVFDYRGEHETLHIIHVLIDNGASLDAKNKHGISARDSIIECGEGIDQGFNEKEWDLRFLLKENGR